MPVIRGNKTDKEKFAGAVEHLYDRVHDARQEGCRSPAPATTSVKGFAKQFNITFTDKDNQQKHPTRPVGFPASSAA